MKVPKGVSNEHSCSVFFEDFIVRWTRGDCAQKATGHIGFGHYHLLMCYDDSLRFRKSGALCGFRYSRPMFPQDLGRNGTGAASRLGLGRVTSHPLAVRQHRLVSARGSPVCYARPAPVSRTAQEKRRSAKARRRLFVHMSGALLSRADASALPCAGTAHRRLRSLTRSPTDESVPSSGQGTASAFVQALRPLTRTLGYRMASMGHFVEGCQNGKERNGLKGIRPPLHAHDDIPRGAGTCNTTFGSPFCCSFVVWGRGPSASDVGAYMRVSLRHTSGARK